MKLGRTCSEDVLGDEPRVRNRHPESPAGIGCPDAAVLGAERAVARARWNRGRLRLPSELERNVAAVASARNNHGFLLFLGSLPIAGPVGRVLVIVAEA